MTQSLGLRDLRSVHAVANKWDNDKKVKRLRTLLRRRAWAIFDALLDTSTNTYEHLKEALLSRFSPDTEEDRQSANESLSQRKFCESQESVGELARDVEKLLSKASPGLPAVNRNAELCYHLRPSQCFARKSCSSVETVTKS